MQAIQVKFLGPTNTKPSRIKAVCYGGSLTVSKSKCQDLEGNIGIDEDVYKQAALLLVEKMGWGGETWPSGDKRRHPFKGLKVM